MEMKGNRRSNQRPSGGMQSVSSTIVTDGRVYEKKRDPPGQKSVYIIPGDQERETYRIATFREFPEHVPIDPVALARHGFVYTGYKDRVKCFSCGYTVHEWMSGDNPTLPKWHDPDCSMLTGIDCANQPVNAFGIRKNIFGGLGSFNGPPSPSVDSGYSSSGPSTSSSSMSNGKMSNSGGKESLNGITQSFQSISMQDASMEKLRQQNIANISVASTNSSSGGSRYQTARYVGEPKKRINPDIVFATISTEQHRTLLESLDLYKETERRKSFKGWPKTYEQVSTIEMASSGFFYLGNLDRTQCFSCAGVLRNWAPGDNISSEHRRHFPDCKMVNGNEPRNVSCRMQLVAPPDASPQEQEDLKRVFTLSNAVSPHMAREEARKETFDRRWPATKVNATVDQIAKAGFFFLGERDRAKCWYCNGGLQNWDPNDEPWTEHAKWFPGCEFVMRVKGVAFVRRLFDKFPNLNRPRIRNQRDEYMPGRFEAALARLPPLRVPNPVSVMPCRNTTGGFGSPAAGQRMVAVGADQVRGPSAGQLLMSGLPLDSGSRSTSPNLLKDALGSEIAVQAKEMGFGQKSIRKAIEKKINQSNSNFETAMALIDALLEAGEEEEDEPEESDMDEEAPGSPPGENLKRKDSASSLKGPSSSFGGQSASKKAKTADDEQSDELRSLVQERLCKNCKKNDSNTLVNPCGHLSLCEDCSTKVTRCRVCSTKIESTIKIFRV